MFWIGSKYLDRRKNVVSRGRRRDQGRAKATNPIVEIAMYCFVLPLGVLFWTYSSCIEIRWVDVRV